MTSEKKIQSNQRNAKRSTGPTSKRGRKHSSRNALKTGLYADPFALDDEDPQEYERSKSDLKEKYSPIGPVEETLVQLIADNLWRLKRIRLIETECLTRVRENRLSHEIRKLSHQNLKRFISDLEATPENHPGKNGTTQPPSKIEETEASTEKLGDFPRKLEGDDPDTVYTEALVRFNAVHRLGDTLLEAYVSRTSETLMADIDQQRRRVTRELMQNVAALETMQERRKTVQMK